MRISGRFYALEAISWLAYGGILGCSLTWLFVTIWGSGTSIPSNSAALNVLIIRGRGFGGGGLMGLLLWMCALFIWLGMRMADYMGVGDGVRICFIFSGAIIVCAIPTLLIDLNRKLVLPRFYKGDKAIRYLFLYTFLGKSESKLFKTGTSSHEKIKFEKIKKEKVKKDEVLLKLSSTPPGATVFIDGVERGEIASDGTLSIRVSVDEGRIQQKEIIYRLMGYKTCQRTFNLMGGSTITYSANLEPLAIETDSG